VALAAAGAVLLLGAAWRQRDRARHLAVPVLADPSLPVPPGVELPELAGCGAEEVARVGGRITALLEDGDGALWIGTFDGGLFRGGPEISEVAGLRGRERFVNALVEHDGLLWVATQGGLLALDGGRRVLTLLAGEGVPALARGGAALYAGTARGPFRVSAGTGAEPLGAVGPSGEPLRVTALVAAASRLWIGTASGAYSLPLATLEAPLLSREARWHPLVFGDPAAETNVVTALAPLADGAVAGTDDGGIVRLRADGGVTALRFTDARANEVNPGAAAAGAGGAALLGTQGGGLLVARARGPAVEALRVEGLGRTEVSAVGSAGDEILVGTAAGVVSELRCGPRLTDGAGPAAAGMNPLLVAPARQAHP
jgi:ligand-binding sensor domain-containing protein